MYNRYVQQEDGSFRKSRLTDASAPTDVDAGTQASVPPEPLLPPPALPLPPRTETPSEPKPQPAPPKRTAEVPMPQGIQGDSVNSFLKQLLPQNFDTADLIVVLLLLLMSEKETDSPNTALLTLVIYLFL